MKIKSIRSSAIKSLDLCNQQYFLEYNLGLKGPSNIKATKGTIFHKCMELAALSKLAAQTNNFYFKDPETNTEFPVDVPYSSLLKFAFENNNEYDWTDTDYKECLGWIDELLEFCNGAYDPRNCKIIKPEFYFKYEIKKDWAKLEDDSYLTIEGTTDLIIESGIGSHVFEVVDYKTAAKRINWGTGKEITYESLHDDSQLLLYFFVMCELFPEIEDIIMTIIFVRDGGPFSLSFSREEDYPRAEIMLRSKFEEIKSINKPKLHVFFGCRTFCYFGKNEFKNSGKTICEFFRNEVQLNGLDKVVDEYADQKKLSEYVGGGKVK